MRARCACIFAALVPTSSAMERGDAPPGRYDWLDALMPYTNEAGALEKYIDNAGGSCDLGTYIGAMPCRGDIRSEGCCNGLRNIFFNKCPCRPIPGIVAANGARPLDLVTDFMRCNYTHGSTSPIDFVSQALPCIDQTSWCADGIPDVDVRLDGFENGYVQIKDASYAWVDVGVEDQREEEVAATVCKALGYLSPKAIWRSANRGYAKTISCDSVAASHGSIALCQVRDSSSSSGALGVICNDWYRPSLCIRLDQNNQVDNRLICEGGNGGQGISVRGHTRRVGGASAVCGTAGIDERRISWYDGYRDDFAAYLPVRDRMGRVTDFSYYFAQLPGIELVAGDQVTESSKGRLASEMERRAEMQRLKELANSGASERDVAKNHLAHVMDAVLKQ